MLEFRARIPRSGNVADLLELQSAFQGDRILSLAAHEEEALRVGVFFGNGGDLRVELEGSRYEIRQFLHRGDDFESIAVG